MKSSTWLLLTVGFSCFSDKAWSFVAPIVLSRTCSQSTFFSSIYSLVELVFVILFASPVGTKLSHIPRIKSYKASIIGQNILTAIACGSLVALVQLFIRFSVNSSYDSRKDWRFILIFIALCFTGGTSAVFSISAKVLLSKDMLISAVHKESLLQVQLMHGYLPPSTVETTEKKEEELTSSIVIVCEPEKRKFDDSPEFTAVMNVGLAKANSIFSFIDLSMALIAPVIIGLICDSVFWKNNSDSGTSITSLTNTMWAAVLVGGWNVLSCIPEILIPDFVIKKFDLTELLLPQLQKKDPQISETTTREPHFKKFQAIRTMIHEFGILFQQPAFLAFFAFSLLYCTVLTPHSAPLVSYLVGTRNFSSTIISLFAAASEVIGICGLQLVPALIKRNWTTSGVGVLGQFLQVLSLIFCMIAFSIDVSLFANFNSSSSSSISTTTSSLFENTNTALIYIALSAISLSRFGLWMSDNAVALLLQQTVKTEHISTVNGSLNSIYSLFSAIALIVTIFTPVNLFIIVVAFSFGVITLSFALFFIYWILSKRRKSIN